MNLSKILKFPFSKNWNISAEMLERGQNEGIILYNFYFLSNWISVDVNFIEKFH